MPQIEIGLSPIPGNKDFTGAANPDALRLLAYLER
jgi:hypothetical protein